MIKQLPLVLFTHQQDYFALEASLVKGQGSCAFKDSNTPLLPFNQFLKPGSQQPGSPSHWLALASHSPDASKVKPWLLGLESEAELIELPAERIHPLPPLLLAGRTFPALQAVAWYQQRLVSLIDARALQVQAHPWLASLTLDANQGD
ncbi:hypothetical protein [Marinospirillum insulare]|uniref:Uncharacterized protein n=1 Tax=Marinospirillum insulare TaxID=217169 RepID=A0ABQ5ZY98_9GAMM|nr:hypothetical protein [Marinospirillum insulare]GLR65181.1 hypothetical protein GCM10007878_26200 [Marinospirillum insulare]